MRKLGTWLPFIIGLSIGAGILLGAQLGSHNNLGETGETYDKIKAVLNYVENHYVDTVNTEELTDLTLEDMLQHLDPHSDYFTAEETKIMSEPLQGNFEGIGIEYNFITDTLVVMAIIPGGPSEKAGLKTGDRIIRANDTVMVGKNASEKYIRSRLRGPKGTKVKLQIRRPGQKELMNVTITRGSVPIYSVQGSYMLNENVGYIKLDRFAETSYEEFMKASKTLLGAGMKKMVLDLRGNGGGYLDAATNIADEFLPEGKMIVYTKGRVDGEEKILATKTGLLETTPLVILVDENSASASEVLAGAIQDNDRGTIIGRRTFGKGLVQEEKRLYDGSAFRLTIARYYTPTGRSIQKPYDKGIDVYAADELTRYKHGEFVTADSIKFPDSLKFTTPGGKVVYGGGGIMPDLFIPLDTSGGSNLLSSLFNKNIFTLWSMNYAEKHNAELVKMELKNYIANFTISEALVNELMQIAEKNGLTRNESQQKRSSVLIKKYMKTAVARNIWGDAGYIQVWNNGDKFLDAAVTSLGK